jgi:DNA-binding transcriptional MerR regulator
MREHEGWMKIGEVARRAGLSVDALRFYEERGVLPPAGRTASGYRMFPPDTPERLDFVARAKSLGFSLDEAVEFLSLRSSGASDSRQVLEKVRVRIEDLDRRMAELSLLRDALSALAATCDGNHPTAECPILETFSGKSAEPCHGTR